MQGIVPKCSGGSNCWENGAYGKTALRKSPPRIPKSRETGVSREVAEKALGREIRNAVEKAYARTDLLERRRQLMGEWSQYLEK